MKQLLIGDNAFIGVNHLSQVRARDKVRKLDIEAIVKVFEKAVACGASGFSFSTHPTNHQILRALADSGICSREFDLYPVLPYAEGYVRIANEKGLGGLIGEILSRLSLTGKAKAILTASVSAAKLDPIKMLGPYIDLELESYLNAKPDKANLRSVLLHEVITDLAISFKAKHLFETFAERIHDKYQVRPGFVTRNFARLVGFFQNSGLPLKDCVVMAPFNKVGFQMNPSRESCETCLSNLHEGNVIAISILAAGFLNLDEAVEYLRSLPNLYGTAVGVSSKEHAEQTFKNLATLLKM